MAEVTERMDTKAKAAFDRLHSGQQKCVLEFLQSNPREFLHSPKDVVNAWLVWNGMIGYTDGIVGLVLRAYNKED